MIERANVYSRKLVVSVEVCSFLGGDNVWKISRLCNCQFLRMNFCIICESLYMFWHAVPFCVTDDPPPCNGRIMCCQKDAASAVMLMWKQLHDGSGFLKASAHHLLHPKNDILKSYLTKMNLSIFCVRLTCGEVVLSAEMPLNMIRDIFIVSLSAETPMTSS